jgi:hypothetical protein
MISDVVTDMPGIHLYLKSIEKSVDQYMYYNCNLATDTETNDWLIKHSLYITFNNFSEILWWLV